MFEQNFGFIPAGGHHVQDTFREPCLIPQLRDTHRCLRNKTGGLQYETISRGDTNRRHPALRDHRREIPGGDAGEYTNRMVIHRRVVISAGIHQGFALHEMRHATGKFDDFNDF